MSFGEAIRACLQKYATFSGRARRAEFWYFTLFNLLLGIATGIIDQMLLGPGTELSPVSTLASLALLLPGLAVSARRLHDTGRSAWWLLLVFVPVIGWIVLIVWYATQGEASDNAHGPDPISDRGGDRPGPGRVTTDYGPLHPTHIPKVPRR